MGKLPTGGNPAKGVSKARYEKREREPWPIEKVRAFRETYDYGTAERLIFELLLGTGQRIGDVLRMQWGDVEGDATRVRQSKTGKRLHLPFTADLRATLAKTTPSALYIVSDGTARAATGAPRYVLAARKAIDEEKRDLHSLRYSAAADLCLAGCTGEIAAVTGQSPAMFGTTPQAFGRRFGRSRRKGLGSDPAEQTRTRMFAAPFARHLRQIIERRK